MSLTDQDRALIERVWLVSASLTAFREFRCSHADIAELLAAARLEGQGVPEGWRLVPAEPTDELLMSMAIRYDHGLGVPGYYDQPIFGGENIGHEARLRTALTTMRQLHEEVVGAGFHIAATPAHECAGQSRSDVCEFCDEPLPHAKCRAQPAIQGPEITGDEAIRAAIVELDERVYRRSMRQVSAMSVLGDGSAADRKTFTIRTERMNDLLDGLKACLSPAALTTSTKGGGE